MTTHSSNNTYYYGLDILRAVLMIVGVFWHAVSVISPNFAFVYSSAYHKSLTIFGLIYPEHIFRMEAFFLVSGFLALMVRSRKGNSVFFRARVKRVLIPLLLGCFGVNLLLQIFGSIYMGFAWKNFDMWRWVMHGWFLITLFLCACLDLLLPISFYTDKYKKTFFTFIILLALIIYPMLLYFNAHYWRFFGSIDGNLFNFLVVNTVQFYPFYLLGAWLYIHREALIKLNYQYLGLIFFFGGVAFILDYLHGMKIINIHDYFSALYGITYRFIHLCAAGSVAFLLFYYCYRLNYQGGKFTRYLIQSAIVIYLVHHPIVIIISWLFDTPMIGTSFYYLLISMMTLLLSFAAYEVIRRFSWTRFAFGLKG